MSAPTLTARPFAAALAARFEVEEPPPAWPAPGWEREEGGVWLPPTGPLGGRRARQPATAPGPPPGHPDNIDPETATRV